MIGSDIVIGDYQVRRWWRKESNVRGMASRRSGNMARVFEDTEVDGFLVRLDGPRDGVVWSGIDPAD
jgi:hypothetical protein